MIHEMQSNCQAGHPPRDKGKNAWVCAKLMSSQVRVTAHLWLSDQMKPRMGEETEDQPSCLVTEPKPKVS